MGEVTLPEILGCSIPSTLLRIQWVNFSLSWQWRLWCLTLQKGEERAVTLQKGWPQKPWDHAKPQHGLVFPSMFPGMKRDFSSSFSLPRLHPALGSWQCQHSHPGITVKIAPSSLTIKNTAKHLASQRCPSLLTPGWVPGDFVVGCQSGVPAIAAFPWHSWNSPHCLPPRLQLPGQAETVCSLPPLVHHCPS